MIRPLRRAHRVLVTLLAATVPAALVAVLMHRPPTTAIEQDSGSSSFSISVQTDGLGHRLLTIAAPADRPEVLVYWARPESSTIDAQAVLIGRLDDAVTRLPVPDDLQAGQILLFSPPLNRILSRQALPSGTAS